eukprot:INCI4834.1.p1 GENE.INCI4834.1~~INCI4834.1.p1  ORF type:complete len:5248 (-),score=862.83 INCI4834.1:106-14496(-)
MDVCGVCGGTGGFDCAGACGGSAVLDACGICNGDSSSCCFCEGGTVDCEGICNGGAEQDECGICGGYGETCTFYCLNGDIDCDGECDGGRVVDECGVCDGEGSTCFCAGGKVDCKGKCQGTFVYDECGVCGGFGSSCQPLFCSSGTVDCYGECDGSGTLDSCDVCGGDGSSCKTSSTFCAFGDIDCFGVCNGAAEFDECGVCDQAGASCATNFCSDGIVDCLGVCDGSATKDNCGVCGGSSTTCHACSGASLDCRGRCGGTIVEDECGVCGGHGASCTTTTFCSKGSFDCAGKCGGHMDVDSCGVCGGDGSSCFCANGDLDCRGVCNGNAVLDECLVCNGFGASCTENFCANGIVDCLGECDGYRILDECGVCGGNGASCCTSDVDCNGDCEGTAVVDECGVCFGFGSSCASAFCDTGTVDCAGQCNGSRQEDSCGVCGGTGLSCSDYAAFDPNYVACDSGVKDCSGVCDGTSVDDACGICGGNSATCTTNFCSDGEVDCSGICDGAATTDACGVCGGNGNTCCKFDVDCSGACGGSAEVDSCDVCGGVGLSCAIDTSCNGFPDCKGVCQGSARYDNCGICGGDGSTCTFCKGGVVDCKGECDGWAEVDSCGICGAYGASCSASFCADGTVDCAGECDGVHELDLCGICGGTRASPFDCDCDDGTELDCANVCDGSTTFDVCGVCGGFAESCTDDFCADGAIDCAGDCDGTHAFDTCGVCAGDGSTCSCSLYDCAGECGGSSVVDECDVCGGFGAACSESFCAAGIVDCKGECDGGRILDACGVCDGNGKSCGCAPGFDCDGVCGGKAVEDSCGVCGGYGATCADKFCSDGIVDCAGECDGSHVYDQCGVCAGNSECNSFPTVYDCNGECGGSLQDDSCGVCGGTGWTCAETSCTLGSDCKGECGGSATEDDCGICGGDSTSCNGCWNSNACNYKSSGEECTFPATGYNCKGVCILDKDCDGVCGGSDVDDSCNVCGGNGATCAEEFCSTGTVDCDGVCDGSALVDECDVCDGDGTSCVFPGCSVGLDCDGVCGGYKNIDECGVCGGFGSTCVQGWCSKSYQIVDCAGECQGSHEEDTCGICGGDGSSCVEGFCATGTVDCYGDCDGSAVADECGVCNGRGVSCTEIACDSGKFDCHGACDGSAVFDDCGVCGGDSSGCQRCGNPAACNEEGELPCSFAKKFRDCNGNCIANLDCDGTCGGKLVDDACGICDGDGSSCTGCTDTASCNYRASKVNAITIEKCVYPTSKTVDCKGNCIVDIDCNGVCGGSGVEDGCGVCKSPDDKTIYYDCAGTCFGVADEDACGVCGGDSSTCIGCTDTSACNYDELAAVDSDLCWKPDNSCRDCWDNCKCAVDCAGDCGGTAETDSCDVCGGDGTACDGVNDCTGTLDCEGTCDGSAVVDDCGVCDGDSSTCAGCMTKAACNYNKFASINDADSCVFPENSGEDCFGNCLSFYDCLGVCGGTATDDICGICDGGAKTKDCNDVCSGGAELDACGVCGGDSTLCTGCPAKSACNYFAGADIADYTICSYPYSSDYDCFGKCVAVTDCGGKCGGDRVIDECGVCAGFGATCTADYCADGEYDCLGKCGGYKKIDDCGICGGDSSVCDGDSTAVCESGDYDCYATCDGTAVYDSCGDCGGFGAVCAQEYCADGTVDCRGECDGTATVDACDVCGGDSTSCASCSDTKACNYNDEADIANNLLCLYPKDLTSNKNDCFGNCRFNIDCEGTCGGNVKVDDCGLCGGEDVYLDCAGTCYGDATFDACGACGGDSSSCGEIPFTFEVKTTGTAAILGTSSVTTIKEDGLVCDQRTQIFLFHQATTFGVEAGVGGGVLGSDVVEGLKTPAQERYVVNMALKTPVLTIENDYVAAYAWMSSPDYDFPLPTHVGVIIVNEVEETVIFDCGNITDSIGVTCEGRLGDHAASWFSAEASKTVTIRSFIYNDTVPVNGTEILLHGIVSEDFGMILEITPTDYDIKFKAFEEGAVYAAMPSFTIVKDAPFKFDLLAVTLDDASEFYSLGTFVITIALADGINYVGISSDYYSIAVSNDDGTLTLSGQYQSIWADELEALASTSTKALPLAVITLSVDDSVSVSAIGEITIVESVFVSSLIDVYSRSVAKNVDGYCFDLNGVGIAGGSGELTIEPTWISDWQAYVNVTGGVDTEYINYAVLGDFINQSALVKVRAMIACHAMGSTDCLDKEQFAVLEGFSCLLSDEDIAKVAVEEDGCRLYFDGSETSAGDVTIQVQSEDGLIRTVGFRVWLPVDVEVEASDTILSQIGNIDGNPLPYKQYQWATVKATASIQGPIDAMQGLIMTPRLDVTQFVSLYVEENNYVRAEGLNIYGISPGTATVFCKSPCVAEPLDITVNNQMLGVKLATYPMNKIDLGVPAVIENMQYDSNASFDYFTEFNVTVLARQLLTAEHQLATVYSWAVFSDGAEMVVDDGIEIEVLLEGTVYVADNSTPPTIGVGEQLTVQQMSGTDFILVSWIVQGELIAEHQPYIGLLFPDVDSVLLELSERVIYSADDALVSLGAPFESVLTTTMIYVDGSERDFSEDLRTIYTSVDGMFTISGNTVTLDEATMGEDTITVEYKFYTEEVAEVLLKSDAMNQIVVNPIAYPCAFEDKTDCDIRTTLYQVGGIFQQLDILIAAQSEREVLFTADNMLQTAQVSVDCNYLTATGGDCSSASCDSDECVIAEKPLSQFFLQGVDVGKTTVSVYWDIFVGTFDIALNASDTGVTKIEVLEVCSANGTICIPKNGEANMVVSGIAGDTFYVSSRITFADGTTWIDSEQKDLHPTSSYLTMISSDSDILSLDTTRRNEEVQLHLNADGVSHVKLTVAAGVVTDYVFVIPNLMPGPNDLDIGQQNDFPWVDLALAEVGDVVNVPLHYNTNGTALTGFQFIVYFDSNIMTAVSVKTGADWDGALSFTVGDPAGELLILSAEPASTTSGENLEIAILTFSVKDAGSFDVSAVLIETLTYNDAPIGLCNRDAIAANTLATADVSRRRLSEVREARSNRRKLTSGTPCSDSCTALPVGDVNGDCRFTVRDISWLKRYVGGETMKYVDKSSQLVRADADLNGIIDGVDVGYLDRVLTKKYRFIQDFPNVTVGTCDITIQAAYLDAKNQITTGLGESMYVEIGSVKNVDNAIVSVGNDDFGIVETSSGFAVQMDSSESGVYTAKLLLPDNSQDLSEDLEFAIMMQTFSSTGTTSLQRLYPFYGSSWKPFADVGYSFEAMPIYAPQYADSVVDSFDFGCTCDGACFGKDGYYKAGCYDNTIDDECVKCDNNPEKDEGPAYYFTDTGFLKNECPYKECAAAPDGYFYTNYVFFSSDCKSAECPTCPVGEWNSGCDQTVNQSKCEQCTAPPEGHYWVAGGDTHYLDDCATKACNIECDVGFFNYGCNGTTSAGECVPCSDPPTGHHYIGDGNYTDSCPTAECVTDCPIGQYNLGCDQTTSSGECVACTSPPDGYYWTTDGDLLDECEVAECRTDCPRGMFNDGCDQTATNGTCVDCSVPPPGYYIAGDGDLVDECPEVKCFTECPIGEYNDGCSGTTNNGTCTQCTIPDEGYYWSGDGDYVDACPTTECPVCQTVGQWNQGCDQTTYHGDCVWCVAHEGHYWTSVGDFTGSDSCAHKACNIDCPVGQWNKGCNGTNSKGQCVDCTAPPSGYYYTDDGNYTDSCTYEACPIDCPIGQWRDGCDQTSSSGVCVDCTAPPEGYYWTSDGNFTDSCEIAQCTTNCPVGFYNEGCNGTNFEGECVACATPPSGYFWVGDGEYSDACEVEPCNTDCPIGYYNTGCDGTSSSGSCTLCTAPPDNYYFVTDGDLDDSCQVESCLASCPLGEYAEGCGGTSPGECIACSSPPDGYYFTSDGGYEDECASAECVTDCAFGFYNKGCDGTTSNGTCTECSALPDGYYFTSNGGLADSCGTAKCDITCPIGQYRAGCDGTTVEGECAPCTATEGDYYFYSNGGLEDACVEKDCDPDICVGAMYLTGCGGTNSGTCANCSAPPPGYYFTLENGGFTDSCPVLACEENCPIGQFRAGCEGSSAGACVNCSTAPSTSFYTSDGGLRDACDVAPCGLCPTGEYNKGCENGFDEGECQPCTNAPPGSYYLEHALATDATGLYQNGGQANNCPYEECDTSCDPGFYNFGCDGTTNEGVCVACSGEMQPCLQNGAGDMFAYMDTSTPADIAKLACESHYGQGECTAGTCGGFKFYHRRGPGDACRCDSPAGEFEFVYENHFNDESVNADVGNSHAFDFDTKHYVENVDLFVRVKVKEICDGSSWEVTLLNLGELTDEAALDPDYTCSDFYWTDNGGLEDACPFEMCDIACPVGQYNSGCGGTSPGTCVDCSTPDDGMFWVGDGNLADSCPTATCEETCPGGTTRSSCGGDSTGSCEVCGDTTTGFKFNESAVGCTEQKCRSSCNASFYLAGTCANFQDYVCTPCKKSFECADGFGIITDCDGTGFEDAVCESLSAVSYTCDEQECGVGRADGIDLALYSMSVVLAGDDSVMSGTNSFMADGRSNIFNDTSDCSFVSGGKENTVRGTKGAVFGGNGALVDGDGGVVVGGESNRVAGENNVVMGGVRNDVCDFSGTEVVKCGVDSVSASGFNNDCPGSYSMIGGGYGNTAVNDWISILAGRRNRATSNYASAPGGYLNKVVGRYGVVLGGSRNTATGKFSVAFGWYTRSASTRAGVFSFSGDGKTRVCRSLGENTINTCTNKGYFINDLNLETLVENQRRGLGEVDGNGALALPAAGDDHDERVALLEAGVDQVDARLVERRAQLAKLRQQMERLKHLKIANGLPEFMAD